MLSVRPVLQAIERVGVLLGGFLVGTQFVERDGEAVVFAGFHDFRERDAHDAVFFLQGILVHEGRIFPIAVVEEIEVDFAAGSLPPGLDPVGIIGSGVIVIGVEQVEVTAADAAVFDRDRIGGLLVQFGKILRRKDFDGQDFLQDNLHFTVLDVAEDVKPASFLFPVFVPRLVLHHMKGNTLVRDEGLLIGGGEILVVGDIEGAFLQAGGHGRQGKAKEKGENKLFHTFLGLRPVGLAINWMSMSSMV